MKRTALLAMGCGALLLAVLFGTNPAHTASAILIVPFVLLFVLLTLLCATFFARRGQPHAKSLRMGAFLAGVPVMVLIFQSIGQLTPRDLLTILTFFGISYFYVTRANARAE